MSDAAAPVLVDACLSLDGRHLEAAWWGPAPDAAATLVLLHEGLGCVAAWRDVPRRLAAATGLGVFACSRFGYGQSGPAEPPWPLTYMHEEALTILPRVLDAAGIRRAILIGHSDGGSIAAIHAGGVPDPRIAGIVTIAAHFFVEDQTIASIEQIRLAYETTDLRDRLGRYHADPDATFRGWSGAWLDPRFRAFDITGYLASIAVPVLGLQGADDPYGTEEQLRAMERHVTAPLRTRIIQGAKHAPHLEAREPTLAAIAAFARTHLPGPVA